MRLIAQRETGRDAGWRPFFVGPAALAYFALTFAAGFVLGAVRTLAIAPPIGEIAAVAIEAPIMLGVSWLACRWAVTRFRVPGRIAPRAAMGALAIALLVAAELGLAVLAFGRTPEVFLASYGSVAGAIGLVAQLGFAAMPLVLLWNGTRNAT